MDPCDTCGLAHEGACAEVAEAATTVTTLQGFMDAAGLTVDEVRAQFADIVGEDAPVVDEADFQSFEMPIMVIEGVDTGDGRYIDPGILTWRDLPLSVMGILKTTYGHQEAELVGRLDTVERIDISKEINSKTGQAYGDGVTALKAVGVFTKLPNAEQMADLIRNQFIRGVSVDLGDVESVLEMVDEDGNVVEDEDPWLDLFWFATDDSDDDVEDTKVKYHFRERMTAARVMGVTICPFPAFEGAFIRLPDGTETPRDAAAGVTASAGVTAIRVLDDAFERDCAPCRAPDGAIVASAGAAPMYPPKSWFEMPEPDELTPFTITDDGRFFGHAAGWQSCHTGYQGQCLLATKSRTGYSNFMVGALKTAEGDIISVGRITMGTGHANTDPSVTTAQAQAHYDNTGTAAAVVTAVDGKHGVWVCGALEPDLSELQVRRLRGSALSGDWRPHGRGIEMIAILAVNTPGFIVPRARVASGRVVALVAAGVVQGQVAEQRRADPQFASFMQYMLDKDAAEMRTSVQRRHEEAQRRAADHNEEVARTLRARVHGS